MFRTTPSAKAADTGSTERAGLKAWLRRGAAVVSAALVGTTALAGSGVTASPVHAALPAPFTHDEVTSINFDNQGWNWDLMPVGFQAGDAQFVPVAGDEGNHALLVTPTAAWQGIDTNPGANHVAMVDGNTYTFSALVGLPDNGDDEVDTITARLYAYPGWTGLATVEITEGEWEIVTGAMTTADGDRFRLVGDTEPTPFLVDDVSVMRHTPIETPGDDDYGYGDDDAVAAPVFPNVPGTVVRQSSFGADGNWSWDIMSHGGHTYVDGVWQLGRAGWSGIFDTNDGSGHFPMTVGETYTFQVAVRAASDEFDGVQVNLAGYPGSHAGNVILSADEWTILTGELTAAEGQRFRVTAGEDVEILVHSARLIRNAAEGDAPSTDRPAINVHGEVIAHHDFATGTMTDALGNQWLEAGVGANLEFITEGDNTFLSYAQTADWQGLQTPAGLLENGVEYQIAARVRWAEGDGGDIRFVSSDGGSAGWGWIGNTNVGNEWTVIGGTFTVNGFDNPIVRLNAGAAGTVQVDEIIVTRVGGDAEEINRDNWNLVYELDFAQGFFGTWDADHGGTQANVIANPFGEGNVLEITRSDDWHGLGSPLGMLAAGASYYFEMNIRIAEDGPDTANAMFLGQPGWPHIGSTAINNEGWTTVSGSWTPVEVGSNVRVVTSNVASHETYRFYVDHITVWQTRPAPDLDFIEPGTVVLRSDFEDNLYAIDHNGEIAGEWFERQTTSSNAAFVNLGDAYFSFIPGAAGTTYGLALNNRDNQGDGHMINVANILEGGRSYRFRGYARFLDGTSGNLTLSSQTDGAFTNLVTGIGVGADWTAISGSFVFPAFDGQANLYFETPWVSGDIGNTSDFAIDQFEIYIPEELTWQRDLPRFFESLDVPTVGVAVDTRELTGTAAEMVLHHFNHIVGENHMKPEAWFAGQGMNTFRRHPQATAMLNFAVANDITLFGHVLVWHSQHPGAWFFTDTGLPGGRTLDYRVPGDSDIMRERMRQFIELVAADIAGDYGLFGSDTNPMNSWEVVNEVVAGNPNVASGMRENSPWFQAFGPGNGGFGSNFMLYAFEYADYYFNNVFHVDGQGRGSDFRASGDNRITLWINDYNTERGLDSFVGGVRQLNTNTKRYVLLNITNWLIDNGAPIDGVGHQFHAGLQWPVQGLADALAMFTYTNGHVNAPLLQAITEIDVTVPTPVTEAGLLAQGHYYYQAFEIIRRHQATYGDIDNVTIWGLTDNRSWRADQAPLLFDAYFQAKPAFFGALTGGIGYNGQTPDFNLPPLAPIIRVADVFGSSVELTRDGFDAQIGLLPLQSFATGTGGFTTRWTPEALYVLAELPVLAGEIRAAGGNAGRRLSVEYAGLDFIVWPDGVFTGSAGNYIEVPGVDVFQDDTAWIVRIPHTAAAGSQVDIVVTSIEGSQQSPQGHIWDGQITFRETLSVTDVVLTDATPTFESAIWADAQVIRTDVNTAGNASGTGATAEVRTVWRDGGAGFSYLYVLADINDDTPDHTGAQRHETDSFEVFISLLNNRQASYEHLYDLQARFHRNGEVDINGTPYAVHAARVSHEVVEVAGGYRVLATIRLATDTGHLQGNWNSAFGTIGEAFGFDVQVNDARDGSRYSAQIWADPTGQSWMSTYRWGVARLVESLSDDAGNDDDGNEYVPVPPRMVEMPDGIVGLFYNAASSNRLRRAGFTYRVERVYDATVSRNRVISTNTATGELRPFGYEIVKTVSMGARMVAVPNLVGERHTDARSKLRRDGFATPPVVWAYSADVPRNHVISTNVPPGQLRPEGFGVVKTVSLGRQLVEIPDVTDLTAAVAELRLSRIGFNVEVRTAHSETVRAGRVIRSTPAAGLRRAVGTQITIIVSQGARPVNAPIQGLQHAR